jgi:hypothetical protein
LITESFLVTGLVLCFGAFDGEDESLFYFGLPEDFLFPTCFGLNPIKALGLRRLSNLPSLVY